MWDGGAIFRQNVYLFTSQNILKDVFKSTVVYFEDGVLGVAGGGVRVM